MGRVMIIQPVNFDVRSAEEFGEVVYMMDKAPSPFNPMGFDSNIKAKIVELNFNPNEDYFCMAGSTLVVSLALLCFMTECQDGINVLMFDASIGKYRVRELKTERSLYGN